MTADDIAYVDHDPLIPTHLGTDAPHVHVRTTDRCLRRPVGVECLSPAELRAEVARLGRMAYQITHTVGLPSQARIWRDGVLIFDGVSRS